MFKLKPMSSLELGKLNPLVAARTGSLTLYKLSENCDATLCSFAGELLLFMCNDIGCAIVYCGVCTPEISYAYQIIDFNEVVTYVTVNTSFTSIMAVVSRDDPDYEDSIDVFDAMGFEGEGELLEYTI